MNFDGTGSWNVLIRTLQNGKNARSGQVVALPSNQMLMMSIKNAKIKLALFWQKCLSQNSA